METEILSAKIITENSGEIDLLKGKYELTLTNEETTNKGIIIKDIKASSRIQLKGRYIDRSLDHVRLKVVFKEYDGTTMETSKTGEEGETGPAEVLLKAGPKQYAGSSFSYVGTFGNVSFDTTKMDEKPDLLKSGGWQVPDKYLNYLISTFLIVPGYEGYEVDEK